MKKYLMNWSQADCAWQVVYANSNEEAIEKYENGEFDLDVDGYE